MGARGERRSENDPSQSKTVRATKGNIRCGPDILDQPSTGGVVYSPCAGEIAGASKPAVGLRWCPRLPLTAMTLPLCCGMWSCGALWAREESNQKPYQEYRGSMPVRAK